MSTPPEGTTKDADEWRRDPAAKEAKADEGIDHFDRLPDSVLLAIFNLLGDVKELGRCCVVSRRFHAIAALVDRVIVRVDCVISDDPSSSAWMFGGGDKARGVFSHLVRVVLSGLVRPLQALGQIIDPTSAVSLSRSRSLSSSASFSSSEVSHHSPAEVLRNFKEIRYLRIELPAGELGVNDGVFLKWKAEFGSSLDNCVILGASSVLPSPLVSTDPPSPKSISRFQEAVEDEESEITPDSLNADKILKRRLFWTISCLIAASARHYLLRPIIAEHETLEKLELTDLDGQGMLTMNRRQLQKFGVKPAAASGSSQRTLMPALSIRLWHSPHLELLSGVVLKGATLVAVRPSEQWRREVADGGVSGCAVESPDSSWISNAFDEPYRSGSRILLKGTAFFFEMNSF
ncbi:hypothetical protein Cni_G05801 [Canna indica]|uniref:F-box domain-containing protein n=1 Tax=Canna indica TaxID=4628 RepID=A0AAQ3JXB5_9LILI|nr:hypothetical protein Cni_G05801 [Canna indica]